MKSICIGKHSFEIKDYYCSVNQDYLQKEDSKLWLYVYITDVCPASCPFCVNPGKKSGKSGFDLQMFQKTLEIIREHVYGISFTGGEPMLEPKLLDAAIGIAGSLIKENTEIDMVTSGIHLEKVLDLKNLHYLDSIHISRHRTDDDDNRSFMGVSTPTARQIKTILTEMEDPARVVFNCVLDQNGVNTVDRMAKYLEMAAETGVCNTSFISMIPANDYCRKQYVNPEQFNLDQDPRFRVWNHFHDYDYCSCSSGDYRASKRWVRYYYRMPGNKPAPYSRQLVYTASNQLLDGFGGTGIII